MGRALILAAALALAACSDDATLEGADPAPQPPGGPAASDGGAAAPPAEPRRMTVAMPGGELQVEFVEVAGADGAKFWIATTETTWEVFDLFFLRPEDDWDVDGITGPSKSVFPVTRGWGHDGMPALGMTFASAQAFCGWLDQQQLGWTFRLPTVEEWRAAAGPDPTPAAAGSDPAAAGSNPAAAGSNPAAAATAWDAVAWHAGNSGGVPHAVATKAPNAHGLHDTAGNVAEWVVSGEEQPLALGGSFQQGPGELGRDVRLQYTLAWQQRDPQWPKSSWWMSDAGFVGLRLVAEKKP